MIQLKSSIKNIANDSIEIKNIASEFDRMGGPSTQTTSRTGS